MRAALALFLFLFSIADLDAQEPCTDSGVIFNRTEFMPEPSPDLASVQTVINAKFSPTDCGLRSGDIILITFEINCEGEDFNYKVLKTKTGDEIDCGLADFFQATLTWTTARQKDRSLDFGGNLLLKI